MTHRIVSLRRGVGKRQSLGCEPEPDLARRAEFRELLEDRSNRTGDSLIGVKAHFPVGFAPTTHWQAAPQFAAFSLVADAAVKPRADDMEFGFGHRALQSQKQPVIEKSRMIEAILVADERIGDAAQVEQPIPLGVVACHPGDFHTENQPTRPKATSGSSYKPSPCHHPRAAFEIRIDDLTRFSAAAQIVGPPRSWYCRTVDSRLRSTWAAVDWRTYTHAGRAKWVAWIFGLSLMVG